MSLSFCVQDVIKGRVAEESIEQIIAATCMESDEVFEEVIAEYARGYWCDAPYQGMAIARRLWEKGLIDQPRVRGEKYPNIAQGHWMIGGKQIRLPQN